ncbi:hypothetical protein PhaeoP83_01156 [Phaeobacter inhibens]|uniref:REase AHJR-like domain-containing protein n=1 Tax=Phaeobacter inhibens TaxID=221822 RepID=A0ABM6RCA0_9RHOB|nr:HepT-like ribonuclease domain-containing protein [Phaeobacter inhibens]AUQ49447.1 hypothetical protein PhaeoP83_01156 [Phaeobacter inhibens]AUQ94002.1 hypothetical protein PhaeoP66_01203 [Phaeobacter inhibens]AUR19250.1 hypothetical protein PhaeoP80_01156 [Phaeobacter inhibens]
MNPRELERIAIEKLQGDYEAEGYEVLLDTHAFAFQSYTPDLVLRKDRVVTLVEVKGRKHPKIESQLVELKNKIESDTNYKFKFVFIEDLNLPLGPEVQSVRSISASLNEAKRAINGESPRAAFLLCWAAFEAASRLALKDPFVRPQSPGRLVTFLAEEGLLTPSESETLRNLISKRNRLIHGDLGIFVGSNDVTDMIRFVEQVYLYNSREHMPEIRHP